MYLLFLDFINLPTVDIMSFFDYFLIFFYSDLSNLLDKNWRFKSSTPFFQVSSLIPFFQVSSPKLRRLCRKGGVLL